MGIDPEITGKSCRYDPSSSIATFQAGMRDFTSGLLTSDQAKLNYIIRFRNEIEGSIADSIEELGIQSDELRLEAARFLSHYSITSIYDSVQQFNLSSEQRTELLLHQIDSSKGISDVAQFAKYFLPLSKEQLYRITCAMLDQDAATFFKERERFERGTGLEFDESLMHQAYLRAYATTRDFFKQSGIATEKSILPILFKECLKAGHIESARAIAEDLSEDPSTGESFRKRFEMIEEELPSGISTAVGYSAGSGIFFPDRVYKVCAGLEAESSEYLLVCAASMSPELLECVLQNSSLLTSEQGRFTAEAIQVLDSLEECQMRYVSPEGMRSLLDAASTNQLEGLKEEYTKLRTDILQGTSLTREQREHKLFFDAVYSVYMPGMGPFTAQKILSYLTDKGEAVWNQRENGTKVEFEGSPHVLFASQEAHLAFAGPSVARGLGPYVYTQNPDFVQFSVLNTETEIFEAAIWLEPVRSKNGDLTFKVAGTAAYSIGSEYDLDQFLDSVVTVLNDFKDRHGVELQCQEFSWNRYEISKLFPLKLLSKAVS